VLKKKSKNEFSLGTELITPEVVWEVATGKVKVSLSSAARSKMDRSQKFLRTKMDRNQTIYGVNTGFGLLSNVRIKDADLKQLQVNLIRSHCVGTGEVLSEAKVRAMLFLRAANLSIGFSGVRPALVEALLEFLNRGIHPVIFSQGSVGASGDLAPLAHLAIALIGEGEVIYQGKRQATKSVLSALKIKPIELGPKEGLALINGTQFMTAIGSLTLMDAEYLCQVADLTGAMCLEALRGTVAAFDEKIHAVRPHPGQGQVAKNLREILTPRGKESAIAKSHEDCGKVQDPYSLRCMPQVHGATRDALQFVREVLTREMNSVTDNPLVFPEENQVLSGGNFHGQVVAMAMDFLSIAVAELGSISEQRIEKLINPALSDLPPFLTSEGGLHSGFMIVQVAAASIVSENKTLCHPACIDSIPTSADKEDHVSMGAWAAVKANKVVENVRRVLSMEMLSASTGLEFHRPLKSTAIIEEKIKILRTKVSKITGDRMFSQDIQAIENLLIDRRF
jgi:histidine ammonia-lyase